MWFIIRLNVNAHFRYRELRQIVERLRKVGLWCRNTAIHGITELNKGEVNHKLVLVNTSSEWFLDAQDLCLILSLLAQADIGVYEICALGKGEELQFETMSEFIKLFES